jgi:hypothetical protein
LLRVKQLCWDHLQAVLSLVCPLLRRQFNMLAVLARSDLSKDLNCSSCVTRTRYSAVSGSG